MKIGITGATGQLGQLVVEELKKRENSDHLVALVRSTEKAKGLGIEACEFDYNNPESLERALLDIDRLVFISANEIGQRARQHKNVIDAAKKSNVNWVVYTSLLRADTSTLSLAGEHLATEQELKNSGLDFTILRNGWYTENYTASIPSAIQNGAFIGSAGDAKISSAARLDYAEALAIVISDENNKGKTFELAGDKSYTLTDLASEISKQTGKEIPYKNLPEEAYAGILLQVGLPEGLAKGLANWDVSASKGDLFEANHQLSNLLGRPTTPLAKSISEVL
ncbi:SDR family oxidoreductase [Aestuariibaculum suncheonense]|uniref:SDR family oxidoreductase n=1 Tax=Aestuariibaculum suncheonense TaxID=1028745 RepID=A0A8J6QDW5_9FLAO|nr:SDR family oxidoreductase [Aestuariibaculum suncheonense]MBD0835263.1 SDR family oxidoreductase [Aestuariibaculum suncheonense]